MARRLVYKESLNGTAPIYREFPVNANQTINEGDIVVLAAGKASIAADAPAAGTVLGVSNTSIVTGATPGPNDRIKVDINPASIYEATYIGAATPAIGTKYDLGNVAYGFDADDTTDGFIQVVGNVDTTNKKADVIIGNRVFTGV